MNSPTRAGSALISLAPPVRVWSFFAAALLILPSFSFAETQTYDLKDFDGIAASEGIHVIVDVGPDFSVVAESDERAQLQRLKLDVRRGTLRARMDNRPFSFRRTKGWKVTVRVAMPELILADATAGADLTIDQMDGGDLELRASSGAELHVATLAGEDVDAKTSSGSRIEVSDGTCDKLDAQSSSGSSLEMRGVECKTVEVSASSGSHAEVFADERITANSSSGASVEVYGAHKQIEINSSSGGTIRSQ